jgi:O-antigen biosynthesis protein
MSATLAAPRTRLGALFQGRRPAASDAWTEFLAAVEPALAHAPRLHRFALPPVLWQPDREPVPLAVWIEGDGEAAERSRAALAGGTRAPTAVLARSLREALTETRSEWLVLVRAGDEPAPLALERLGQAVAEADDADLITCDADEVSADGIRHSPKVRPGPSPDRWLSCDDSGPLLVVRCERAAAVAHELASSTAWRHELALMLAGPGGERHAHVPLLLCHTPTGQEPVPPLEPEHVERVLRRWEPGAKVEPGETARVVRRPVSGEPSVEVIMCFRDGPSLLARSVASLIVRTDYDRLSVTLVDNGSEQAETAELINGLSHHPHITVRRDDRPFNFAALNNGAAGSSNADFLVFLNNDTEVTDPSWITTLLEEATRPEVGAVAPMLSYPDGAVQHAGAALGLHGYAGHPFAGLSPSTHTPFGRADGGTRNWLAVTAACTMVERAKFEAVGGFDESFVVGGNDVDLCLRLTGAGHRSLCVPRALVVHDESRSRGSHVDPGDFAASERSYGLFRTVGDPFYNPNLTLTATDCSMRRPGGTP